MRGVEGERGDLESGVGAMLLDHTPNSEKVSLRIFGTKLVQRKGLGFHFGFPPLLRAPLQRTPQLKPNWICFQLRCLWFVNISSANIVLRSAISVNTHLKSSLLRRKRSIIDLLLTLNLMGTVSPHIFYAIKLRRVIGSPSKFN